jgi:hypothetical protein
MGPNLARAAKLEATALRPQIFQQRQNYGCREVWRESRSECESVEMLCVGNGQACCVLWQLNVLSGTPRHSAPIQRAITPCDGNQRANGAHECMQHEATCTCLACQGEGGGAGIWQLVGALCPGHQTTAVCTAHTSVWACTKAGKMHNNKWN